MEILLVVLGILCMVAGLIGAFLPVVPGLPFSYVGLLLLQWAYSPFTGGFLLIWAGIVIALMFLDNAIPVWGTKKFGGSQLGVTGSIVGMIVGLFFPPLGFIFGPFIGAFIGEIIAGNKSDKAFKSALGSFIGFMAATGLKVIAAGMMGWYFFVNAF